MHAGEIREGDGGALTYRVEDANARGMAGLIDVGRDGGHYAVYVVAHVFHLKRVVGVNLELVMGVCRMECFSIEIRNL